MAYRPILFFFPILSLKSLKTHFCLVRAIMYVHTQCFHAGDGRSGLLRQMVEIRAIPSISTISTVSRCDSPPATVSRCDSFMAYSKPLGWPSPAHMQDGRQFCGPSPARVCGDA